MSKILLLGPIEDIGGRELEAGFVATILNDEFEVDILSTGNITGSSQVYDMVVDIEIKSLKQLLFKRYAFLRPAAIMSYFRNIRKEPVYFYVNNRMNSRFIKKKENDILKDVIKNYDLVFIIAHLQTLRIKNIIRFSKELNKPVIFRTTGEIEIIEEAPSYLRNVDLFIHHSIKNAKALERSIKSVDYKLIDQTAFSQKQLFSIPNLKRKVKKFLVIGRLSPEKNLINLIRFFKEFSEKEDVLFIVGGGIIYEELKREIQYSENIFLRGHSTIKEVTNYYRNSDCLIISSYTEAGPLVGIDAMAAGKVILSTRVGAMPERLEDTYNDFWFKPENAMSFKKQFLRIKNLDATEVRKISLKNKEVYFNKYSKEAVSQQYKDAVMQTLEKSNKACIS